MFENRIVNAPELRLRLAVLDDVPQLHRLIEQSVRVLQASDYTTSQIESALGSVFGVDRQLIIDGTYYVVEATVDGQVRIIGCGGWSRRKTLFGSDDRAGREDDLLDPQCDSARIRAFFVHPDWARCGVGTRILDACETDAASAGFRQFELAATLTGERLYRARGYEEFERVSLPLGNDEAMPVVRMRKPAPSRP